MKKPKNNLDEMQEQKLLHIEQRSFWLAFWMLIAAILVQQLLGGDSRSFMGECIILAVVGVYMVVTCLKNGLWDRQLSPTPKTNFGISLLTGAVMGSVWGNRFVEQIPQAGRITGHCCVYAGGWGISVLCGAECCG